MNSNNPLSDYKHDIVGKFKDINMAVSSLEEDSLSSPESIEILLAVHDLLLKMIRISKDTLKAHSQQETTLIVSAQEPNKKYQVLGIDGVVVRMNDTNPALKYYLYLNENVGQTKSLISLLEILLPINKIEYITSDTSISGQLAGNI